jgi:hypothetical protein
VSGKEFLADPHALQTEAFGTVNTIVVADDLAQMAGIAATLDGSLTGCIYSDTTGKDDEFYTRLAPVLRQKVGRLLNDRMPTGVAVSPAMNHGGPYPATGHPGFTAVGLPAAMLRFSALHCYDNVRPHRLPVELRDKNPTGVMWRGSTANGPNRMSGPDSRGRRSSLMRVVVMAEPDIRSYLCPPALSGRTRRRLGEPRRRDPYHPRRVDACPRASCWIAASKKRAAHSARECGLTRSSSISLLPESAVQQITRGHCPYCGTIWVHGPTSRVPTTEQEPRRTGDAAAGRRLSRAYLLTRARPGFPATVPHRAHRRTWLTLVNPAGHFNPQVFSDPRPGPSGPPELRHGNAAPRSCDDVASLSVRPRLAAFHDRRKLHVVSPTA